MNVVQTSDRHCELLLKLDANAIDCSQVDSSSMMLKTFEMLIFALLPKLQRLAAMILIGGNILALILLLLPIHQYNLDVVALVTPINVAVVLYLYQGKS